MFKIYTLAAVISVMPVSQQLSSSVSGAGHFTIKQNQLFHFTNSVSNNLFEPEKRPTEAWSQNWMATAQENIRKSEYHFKWDEKLKTYCTPNRKNNLRFFYDEKGFSIEPRTTQIPIGDYDPMKRPDEIKYRSIANWKVNFNLDRKHVGNGKWQIVNNQAEYITENITVQYINNDDGMRQNFIVHKPLSKKDKLKISFNIKTKLKNKLNGNQVQFFHKNKNVLNYSDLKVWDATGKPLIALFAKSKKGRYAINVDTKHAVYPITIDPISTTPSAMVESNIANARMGSSVSSAGDVNGDGYSDVIIGAYFYNNGQAGEGAFYVYHGSPAGMNTTANAVVESNMGSANLGWDVANAGDVNGDGYSDVIVGAPLYNNGQSAEGAFFVYHGSASGINTTAAATAESNQANARMGFSVSSAGDINNDGYSDIVVGANLYTDGQANEGACFVYLGSAAGINTAAPTIIQNNLANIQLGYAVSCAGDVNRDGYSDIIAGAPQYSSGQSAEGAFFIYHGSGAGISTTIAAQVESNLASALLGNSVSSAGDVNGDGYSDIIAGAPQFSSGESFEGAAFVHHGSSTGINLTAAVMVQSNQVNAFMGNQNAVACAGDINGDGYSDVLVGANGYANGEASEGGVFVFFGTSTGIAATATTILESNQAGAGMGPCASAGDVNGDGYSDVVAGASGFSNVEATEGGAFVYHGSAAGINTTATAMVENDQAFAQMGSSVAGAGDVNGDGYSDIIVGAYQYDNGQTEEGAFYIYHGSATGINTTVAAMAEGNQANAQMGRAVGSAGDVNGDGYSDIIVGVPGYNNGEPSEGAFYVYHGSSTGINTTAAAMVQSNFASAAMGGAVASAGDVNGDGYSDVIVGASNYSTGPAGQGAAFVYHGSATGINTTAAAMVQINQGGAGMGFGVAGAGDVNGDGYSDVVVGCPGYNNGQSYEGAAFIYHGSATGINTTAAVIVESNQVDTWMGSSVAGVGDVNGDGYSDVIVGAFWYDNGEMNEGAFFVYHGSAAGINPTVAAMGESNQVGVQMGQTVAGAGDVNGDGYSDIIVAAQFYSNGQTNEGAAFLYTGSATGINTAAATLIESNQAFAYCSSAAGAGDVNGDGYSDVIVGFRSYDNVPNDEGAAFIYHGNSPGNNKRNNIRLYNTDLITPLNSSNFFFGNFGAGLYAKSFLGRDSGKIVWETRLNYNAYSGTPITNSTFFTNQQPAYTDLGLTGIELKSLITKILGGNYTKLRARVKYNPAKAITGQVYGPWRNVSSIIDANNLGALPIELISFKAAWLQKGKTAQLNFTTDKETGICCFDIEKSTDGFNFYRIGTLPAKNTSSIQSYSFIDGNATGKKQFYRIKIKGITGQLEYSNIQQLQHNTTTEILVFPNPTTDVLQLQLNGNYNKMNVQIVNSSGQVVTQLNISASNQIISIPVQNLAAGQYWLKLQSSDQKQVLQFVKQ